MKVKATEVSGQLRQNETVQRRWPLAAAAAGVGDHRFRRRLEAAQDMTTLNPRHGRHTDAATPAASPLPLESIPPQNEVSGRPGDPARARRHGWKNTLKRPARSSSATGAA